MRGQLWHCIHLNPRAVVCRRGEGSGWEPGPSVAAHVQEKVAAFGGFCAERCLLPARHGHGCGEVMVRTRHPSPTPLGRWLCVQSIPRCWLQACCSPVKGQGYAPAPSAGGPPALLHPRATRAPAAVVPSVPGPAHLWVDACPWDAVRPCVTCISDDLSPYYVHFS